MYCEPLDGCFYFFRSPPIFDSQDRSLVASAVAALEGTILSIYFNYVCFLADLFRLSHVCFTSDFDWSAKLGVFTVSAVVTLQPTIGMMS